MKALALAAASSALLALGACTHDTAPQATPSHRNAATVIAPVSCRQQYLTWTQGSGTAVMRSLDAITSATVARNGHRLQIALKQARPALDRAAHHPIPACADARGYLAVLLMHISAASTGGSSSPSVRAALQDVPTIHRHLRDEVKQSVG